MVPRFSLPSMSEIEINERLELPQDEPLYFSFVWRY